MSYDYEVGQFDFLSQVTPMHATIGSWISIQILIGMIDYILNSTGIYVPPMVLWGGGNACQLLGTFYDIARRN